MEMRHAEPVTFSSRWRCCCRVDKGIFIVVIVELLGVIVGCSRPTSCVFVMWVGSFGKRKKLFQRGEMKVYGQTLKKALLIYH